MGFLKKTMISALAFCLSLSHRVFASEEVSKASMGEAPSIYLQAFYAAMATLLVMSVLWAIIFRPKFKSSNE